MGHCQEIPVIPYDDGISGPVYSDDCDRFQTARKLYDEVKNDVALISSSPIPRHREAGVTAFGTGFFVNDGREIVTNAHVVTAMPYLEVVTQDGKSYPARIEKIDELNDLALLEIIGKEPDSKNVLPIDKNTKDLKNGDELVALGYPKGFGHFDLFASPGRYREHGTMIGFLPGRDISRYTDLVEMKRRADQINNPKYYDEVDKYLNSDRIRASMAIFGGNSGGPAVDANGVLVGVMANRVAGARSLMVPAEKVLDLLSGPEKKFNFKYEVDGQQNHKLVEISRKDGSNLPPVILPFTQANQTEKVRN